MKKKTAKPRKANWVPADKLLSGKEFKQFMKGPHTGRVFNADGTHEIMPNGKLVPVPKKDKWMVGE